MQIVADRQSGQHSEVSIPPTAKMGKWADAEVDYLLAFWQTKSDSEIGKVLDRPYLLVRAKRRYMGLKRPGGIAVTKAGPGKIMSPSQRRRERETAIGTFKFPWRGTFKSRQEVQEYLAGDAVQCLLCGIFRTSLGQHLRQIHRWSVAAYKTRYGIPQARGLVGEARRVTLSKRVAILVAKHPRCRFSRGNQAWSGGLHLPRTKRPLWVGEEMRRRFQEEGQLRMVRRAALDPEAVMRTLRAAVPLGLERHVRDEVVAAMVLAVYEGRLHLRDVGRRVGEFIRSHYREFPAKFGHLSLDAPMGDTELRLVDVTPDTAFRF